MNHWSWLAQSHEVACEAPAKDDVELRVRSYWTAQRVSQQSTVSTIYRLMAFLSE